MAETKSAGSIYVEAWIEPRRSIRRILGLGLTEAERLLMVAVNLVASAISMTVLVRIAPDSVLAQMMASLPILARYLCYAFAAFIGYRMLSFLLKAFGGAFGGEADAETCRTVIAWWLLVTSIVSLIEVVLILVFPGALLEIVNLVAVVGSIIIFAVYTAEVHGFRSVGRVAGASVAIAFGLLLVLNLLVLGLVPR